MNIYLHPLAGPKSLALRVKLQGLVNCQVIKKDRFDRALILPPYSAHSKNRTADIRSENSINSSMLNNPNSPDSPDSPDIRLYCVLKRTNATKVTTLLTLVTLITLVITLE